MIEVQVISKAIQEGSLDWLEGFGITDDYFFTCKDEYEFIKKHLESYGRVPDIETFLFEFKDFEPAVVHEPKTYLLNKLREEYFYRLEVEALEKIAALLTEDSYKAFEFMSSFVNNVRPPSAIKGVDIIATADERYQDWLKKMENPNAYFIPTGLPELDEIIGGWNMGEEFVLLFARTGGLKTMLLLKHIVEAWRSGKRVGLLSPEMTPKKIGYRFDTLEAGFSNRALMRGFKADGYGQYINQLANGKHVPLFVATPRDFDGSPTPSKIRSWIKANNLDMVAIDGLKYMRDDRGGKYENERIRLTNVSEDLMQVSQELEIPILTVNQANRGAVDSDEGINLSHVFGADGIAHNCTLVISIEREGDLVKITLQKTRNGGDGNILHYRWDVDKGKMDFISNETADGTVEYSNLTEYEDAEEVF